MSLASRLLDLAERLRERKHEARRNGDVAVSGVMIDPPWRDVVREARELWLEEGDFLRGYSSSMILSVPFRYLYDDSGRCYIFEGFNYTHEDVRDKLRRIKVPVPEYGDQGEFQVLVNHGWRAGILRLDDFAVPIPSGGSAPKVAINNSISAPIRVSEQEKDPIPREEGLRCSDATKDQLERYSGSEQTRAVWYHGTHKKNLRSILSQGLVPDPKRKAWSSDKNAQAGSPDRTSYGGIYLTKNLMTALSSANPIYGQERGDPIVVIVELQLRSMIADEDSIALTLNEISWPGFASNHEPTLAWFYLTSLRNPNHEDIVKRRDEWAQHRAEYIMRLNDLDNPKIEARLVDLCREAFIPAIARRMAYSFQAGKSDQWYWRRAAEQAGFKDEVPQPPEPRAAEEDFRSIVDKITRTMKAIPVRGDRMNRFAPTGRVLEPIRFSGSNRIVAIVELVNWMSADYDAPRSLVVHHGEIPPQFFDDYRKSVGEVPEVVGSPITSSPETRAEADDTFGRMNASQLLRLAKNMQESPTVLRDRPGVTYQCAGCDSKKPMVRSQGSGAWYCVDCGASMEFKGSEDAEWRSPAEQKQGAVLSVKESEPLTEFEPLTTAALVGLGTIAAFKAAYWTLGKIIQATDGPNSSRERRELEAKKLRSTLQATSTQLRELSSQAREEGNDEAAETFAGFASDALTIETPSQVEQFRKKMLDALTQMSGAENATAGFATESEEDDFENDTFDPDRAWTPASRMKCDSCGSSVLPVGADSELRCSSCERRFKLNRDNDLVPVREDLNMTLKHENDDDDSCDDFPCCPSCDGAPVYIGSLGDRAHFRCRQCGLDYSRVMKIQSESLRASVPMPKAALTEGFVLSVRQNADDKTDYYGMFGDYINSKFRGQEDMEMRMEFHAADFAVKHGLKFGTYPEGRDTVIEFAGPGVHLSAEARAQVESVVPSKNESKSYDIVGYAIDGALYCVDHAKNPKGCTCEKSERDDNGLCQNNCSGYGPNPVYAGEAQSGDACDTCNYPLIDSDEEEEANESARVVSEAGAKVPDESSVLDPKTRKVRVTYSNYINPETDDGEMGEDHGWEDEDGIDHSEYAGSPEKLAYNTAKTVLKRGHVEPSSSHGFGSHDWFSTVNAEQDSSHFEKGHNKYYSMHLVGYSDAERQMVHDYVMRMMKGERIPDPEDAEDEQKESSRQISASVCEWSPLAIPIAGSRYCTELSSELSEKLKHVLQVSGKYQRSHGGPSALLAYIDEAGDLIRVGTHGKYVEATSREAADRLTAALSQASKLESSTIVGRFEVYERGSVTYARPRGSQREIRLGRKSEARAFIERHLDELRVNPMTRLCKESGR